MSRLDPIPLEDLSDDIRLMVEKGEAMMGFTPNDALIMARNPAVMKAVSGLVAAIYAPSKIEAGLKRLIGHVISTAAGCIYCQVHTAHGAHNQGVDDAKIKAVWEYETSDLFTDRERAALRVAQGAGQTPNMVTDTEFADLKTYFDDNEIVEIVSVIAMFGFLNRWNATLATELESTPLNFAKQTGLKTDV